MESAIDPANIASSFEPNVSLLVLDDVDDPEGSIVIANFDEPADIDVAISGSGNSPNVLRAIEYANSLGRRTLAFTGRDDSKLGPLARLNIQVNAPHRGRLRNVHLMVLHTTANYFMGAENEAYA